MTDNMEYPKLRPVEAAQVDVQGIPMVLLKDPQAVTDKMVILPHKVFLLASFFDGTRSISDIQSAYNIKYGELLFRNKIEDVIFELDSALLLENGRYRQYMEFLEAEFKKDTERQCAYAGSDYPEKAPSIIKEFGGYFAGLSPDKINDTPVGIASPHIDFERGGKIYAEAYRQLRKIDADTFIIFGTSHYPIDNVFALTKKTFITPLRNLEADIEIIDEVVKNCKTDFFKDEYKHKDEHSIEFQTVILKYLFPAADIKIVPILVSFDSDTRYDDGLPKNNPLIKEFIDALKIALEKTGRKAAFIAGVDFSHIGPYFGDLHIPTKDDMANLEKEDLKSIEFIEKMDYDGFFSDVSKTQETRRVCGLSALYVTMKALSEIKGTQSAKLLEYKQCSDENRVNNVSVAAISFYK